jgi:ribosomal protein S19
LIGSAVLVFDDVNKILFRVTEEKVGFKFSDFDCNDKLNQKEDKKIENKEAKKRNNPITDEFIERLTRGMIDQDSIIKKSFLGKTIIFKNNGVITDCFVTLDKIGRTFGDFTYTSENEVMKKMPILSNTSNEKRPKYNNLTPEKKKRQATKPIKEKKPRKKKKPGKKKEP